MKWFNNLFSRAEASVDSILAGWTKTIKQLEDLAEAKVAEEIKHVAASEFYKDAAATANEELNKARAVAAKIKALFE